MTITDFLLARIAEDEAVAKGRSSSAPIHYSGCYYYNYSLDANWFCDCDEDGKATARVLAECAAKRAIIQKCLEWPKSRDGWDKFPLYAAGNDVLFALAAVYKDHPDYEQEWA